MRFGPPEFSVSVYAVAPYVSYRETGERDWASDLVRRMKVGKASFEEIDELAEELALYVTENRELTNLDAVVAMPRRRPQVVNDLDDLAAALASLLGVDAPQEWLIRVERPKGGRRFWHRTRHTAEEHAESMAVVGQDIYRQVLVLDNVLTTGGTMEGALEAVFRDSQAEPIGLTVLYEPKRLK
jgi:predicted amidophosphoribosyltransferase